MLKEAKNELALHVVERRRLKKEEEIKLLFRVFSLCMCHLISFYTREAHGKSNFRKTG